MKTSKNLFLTVLIVVLFSFVYTNAATIYLTNTTDSIGTFRTNVNSSLTNLNNAGYITTSSLSGTAPITFNSSTGAFGFTNPGFITATSTAFYLNTNPAGFITATSTAFYPSTNPAGFITATSTAFQTPLSFPLAYASTTHITATSPLSITGSVLSMPTSTSGQSGYLSSTDWSTFNGKQDTISAGSNIVLTGASVAVTSTPSFTTVNGVNPSTWLTGVTANSPLSGSGTSASHLIFTNPGFITATSTAFYPNTNPAAFITATSTAFQANLNGAYVSSFLSATGTIGVATSTDTNLGIIVQRSGQNINFTPIWIGTLADSRIASASNWNSKATSTITISAGTGLSGGGNLTANRTLTLNMAGGTCGAGNFISTLSATGTIICTAPSGSGISSLNGSTSSTQTFATSSDTNIGLTIGTANGVHTFTPTWIGTLADGRIASAATWNAKQNAISFPIPVASTSLAVALPLDLTGNNLTWLNPGFITATSTAFQTPLSFPLAYASTTHITATSPLSITGGVLSMPTSTSGQSGYLSSADWSTFNGKLSAAITSINGDTTAGQTLSGSTYLGVVSAGGTTTFTNNGVQSLASANTNIAVSSATGTITLTASSSPSLSSVNFSGDSSRLISGYFSHGISLEAPSSTADIARTFWSPYTTSTITDAWCETNGGNVVVNFKNNGTSFATTTASQTRNTSSSLSVVVTNRKNVAIQVVSTPVYSTTSTITCGVYGTQ